MVVAALFAGCLALFIVAPMRWSVVGAGGAYPAADKMREKLLDDKELALRALKDLESDYAMGKVDQDEYTRSYTQLSLDVAAALEEIKRYERS